MPVRSAILLAAGLGTRLRPLTDTVPKPLLPIGSQRLIDFALAQLVKAGVNDVVINLHHLHAQIRQYVGNGQRCGMHVQYSEEPTILGTGGGIKQAAASLHDRTNFFVINGDILCDLDLLALARVHEQCPDAAATLGIRALHTGEPYTPLTISANGQLAAIGEGLHHYTGIMIGTSRLLDQLPPIGQSSCVVRDGLQPLLKSRATITTYVHTGEWDDIGTPENLRRVQQRYNQP